MLCSLYSQKSTSVLPKDPFGPGRPTWSPLCSISSHRKPLSPTIARTTSMKFAQSGHASPRQRGIRRRVRDRRPRNVAGSQLTGRAAEQSLHHVPLPRPATPRGDRPAIGATASASRHRTSGARSRAADQPARVPTQVGHDWNRASSRVRRWEMPTTLVPPSRHLSGAQAGETGERSARHGRSIGSRTPLHPPPTHVGPRLTQPQRGKTHVLLPQRVAGGMTTSTQTWLAGASHTAPPPLRRPVTSTAPATGPAGRRLRAAQHQRRSGHQVHPHRPPRLHGVPVQLTRRSAAHVQVPAPGCGGCRP